MRKSAQIFKLKKIQSKFNFIELTLGREGNGLKSYVSSPMSPLVPKTAKKQPARHGSNRYNSQPKTAEEFKG